MAKGYVPDELDVVWLQFDPQAGHERAGHRPAVVLSPAAYNSKTGLLVCCPLTTKLKGHPFEVLVSVEGIESAILSDQIKSLDWKARRARKRGTISPEAMRHVKAKLKALLQLE